MATVSAGADVGGTFTDVVVIDGSTRPRAVKVPTTPDDQGEGLVEGLRTGRGEDASPDDVDLVAHGTTTATNAVLERDVARTVLVTTDGFADVLVIGRQNRPSLYDLSAVRPEPLAPTELVVTVAERMGTDGEPVVELTDEEVARVADAVAEREPESVAVSLLFSYANPAHEERLCEELGKRLEVPVTRSSALLPEFREYERASTCVLNAAIAPVMRAYLSKLRERLPDATITVMTSGGGTAGVNYAAEAPVHTLLSGPAAGVVAAGAVARDAGYPDAVAFDMGGTSTDVCLVRDGRPEIFNDGDIGGLPFRTPTVAIHTVGAGGGSLAWSDRGGALRVGPQSAGARPGPACYGRGGEDPTVTDAHAALGHLDPEGRLGSGALELDVDAARRALQRLPESGGDAAGVLTVVRATMARALRRVTTERGVDPSGLALVAYGGAGPLHAVALARDVGFSTVIVPPAPGVLSALGLLLAPGRYEASRTVMTEAGGDITSVWEQLEEEVGQELARQGVTEDVSLDRLADCRYAGQSHELRVPAGGEQGLADTFHSAHESEYGYAMRDERVELVTARVVGEGRPVLQGPPAEWDLGQAGEEGEREIGVAEGTVTARVLHRASLSAGDRVDGPSLIEQSDSTTLLGPGDRAEVDEAGNLVVPLGAEG
ncbi:hydantoinase/oxoprolinase family protein [soil metagenome]